MAQIPVDIILPQAPVTPAPGAAPGVQPKESGFELPVEPPAAAPGDPGTAPAPEPGPDRGSVLPPDGNDLPVADPHRAQPTVGDVLPTLQATPAAQDTVIAEETGVLLRDRIVAQRVEAGRVQLRDRIDPQLQTPDLLAARADANRLTATRATAVTTPADGEVPAALRYLAGDATQRVSEAVGVVAGPDRVSDPGRGRPVSQILHPELTAGDPRDASRATSTTTGDAQSRLFSEIFQTPTRNASRFDATETGAALARLTRRAGPPGGGQSSAGIFGQLQLAGLADKNPLTELVVTQTVGRSEWNQAVGERVVWMAENRIGNARLHLHPAELGPVDVKLSVVDDEVTVLFGAQNQQAREALEAAMPRLRDLFENSGLKLADAGVFNQKEQSDGRAATGDGVEREAFESPVDEFLPARTSRRSSALIDEFA